MPDICSGYNAVKTKAGLTNTADLLQVWNPGRLLPIKQRWYRKGLTGSVKGVLDLMNVDAGCTQRVTPLLRV